jgi:hypothetical protein
MHKYAAATALAIALITMLALAVSASLTPANAQVGKGGLTNLEANLLDLLDRIKSGLPLFKCDDAGTYPGPHICKWKCENELWSAANLWDSTRNHRGSCPPSLQACMATCAAAKNAAHH